MERPPCAISTSIGEPIAREARVSIGNAFNADTAMGATNSITIDQACAVCMLTNRFTVAKTGTATSLGVWEAAGSEARMAESILREDCATILDIKIKRDNPDTKPIIEIPTDPEPETTTAEAPMPQRMHVTKQTPVLAH